jgi:hypothetical protein
MSIISEFDAAMMQAALSVPAVRRLGGGTIRMNESGRPLRAAGRDAVVYELRAPDGRILALRSHLRPDSHRDAALAERYAALGGDPRLEVLRGPSGALPHGVQWILDGVALPGLDHHRRSAPVMAMERVPGRTLLRAVDRLCHEGEREPLALLADAWLKLVTTLEAAGFSHGDLAADNLIVRPDGTIALVDLDTAAWPSFPVPVLRTSGTQGYAHPRGNPLNAPARDRFPALIVWASLRVLARHPALRQQWGDPPDEYGGTLLWSHSDFSRAHRSPLFAALDELDDDVLAPLFEIVRRAIRFPPDDTPPLSEIAERLEPLGLPRLAASQSTIRRTRTSPPGSPATTERSPISPNDERAERNVDSPSTREQPPKERPIDLSRTRVAAERQQRRTSARQLGAAVAARDTATAVRLWEEMRGAPEAGTYAVALHELVAYDAAAAIDRALRRRDDAGLLEAVSTAERSGVALSGEMRAATRSARRRVSVRTAFDEAVSRRDLQAIARLAISGQLDGLGRLNPTQERIVAQALAWPALERALATEDDLTIAGAADEGLWDEDGSLPANVRARVALAHRRTRWAEDVRNALRRRDSTRLRDLIDSAPPGAEQRLTEVESRRILRVSMREAAVSRLARALRDGPDREVVAALSEFETAGAPFSDVLDWAAVRGVVDRISLADALRAAASADPPDTDRLARLLPAARAALVEPGAEPSHDWLALEHFVLRAAHLGRLREAIASDDDASIASAAVPDTYGAISLLTADERARVAEVLSTRRDIGRDRHRA